MAADPTAGPGFREVGRGLPRWVEGPLALLGLAAAAPWLLLAGLAVRLSSPGPAIFRQERVGRGGRRFVLYKLRTMRDDPRRVDSRGTDVTAAGDPRITPVGRLLRRTKLDELPQLWNVLRGDLSLVGPRPEVPRWVRPDDDLVGPLWRRVLAVRPGLTDPVTLRLRDEEGLLRRLLDRVPEHRVEDDDEEEVLETIYRRHLQPWKLRGYAEYLERRTPWSDLRCLVATLLALVRPPEPVAAAEIVGAAEVTFLSP